jgi:hypothetical protein
MNSNLLLIRDKFSYFSDKLVEEAKPSQQTVLQFSYYNKIFVAREYKQNILIPNIPCVTNLYFPISYKLVSHVCVSNDFHKDILDNNGIECIKLNMYLKPNNDSLKISNAFNKFYKYGCILNFKQDIGILKDLISVFYESSKHQNNIILLLGIESEDTNQTLSYIEDINRQLNIDPSSSKIILSINDTIDDNIRMSIINTIDCLLQMNTVFVSDLEYYYALSLRKRIIGKYNLDKRYEIETVSYHNKLFKFDSGCNFFHKFDDHDLYQKLKNVFPIENKSMNQIYSNDKSTGISKIIV